MAIKELWPSSVILDQHINIYDVHLFPGKDYILSFDCIDPIENVATINIIGYKHSPNGISEVKEINSDIMINSSIFNYKIVLSIPKDDDIIFNKLIIKSSYYVGISNVKLIGKQNKLKAIDNIASKYKLDLSKDKINRISYLYPISKNDSFHVVASNHIKYLKELNKNKEKEKSFEIDEIDMINMREIHWNEKRNLLIHPILYPFATPASLDLNLDSFARLMAMKNKIGGFDVADSDRISQLAVNILNKMDLVMVPSNFSKDTYINSGVESPVEVLSHGLPDEFLVNKIDQNEDNTYNDEINNLRRLRSEGNILILFFLMHSGYRKGSDLVVEVMRRIQSKFYKVLLVVKGPGYSKIDFAGVNTIEIKSWMDNNDLRRLYDICDICLVPSRGGGFELNAIEAISRGVVTLATNAGCFLDYSGYFITINVNGRIIEPLPGNPIHTGYGFEVDINDFENKLTNTMNNLEKWKARFKVLSIDIRQKYTWRNTANILEEYLKKYEFIQ